MSIKDITFYRYKMAELLDNLNKSFLDNKIDITHLNEELLKIRKWFNGLEKWETIPDNKAEKTNSKKSKSYRSSCVYYFLRRLRLILDENKCYKCKSSQKLTLHHVHYNTYFCEKLDDVKILCWDCHKNFHNIQEAIHDHYSDLRKGQKMINAETKLTPEKMRSNLKNNLDFAITWTKNLVDVEKGIIPKFTGEYSCRTADRVTAELYNKNQSEIKKLKRNCGMAKRYKEGCSSIFFPISLAKNLAKCNNNDEIDREIKKEINKVVSIEPYQKNISQNSVQTKPTVALPTASNQPDFNNRNPPMTSETKENSPQQIDQSIYISLLERFYREHK